MTALPTGMVHPGTGPSLAEVLPSALAALGLSNETNTLGLPPAHHYCVLLVDGLGAEQLAAHAAIAPVLTALLQQPLSEVIYTGAPSTTATSITTLGTGLRAGRHGVVGYTFRYRDRQGDDSARRQGGDPSKELLEALSWPSHADPQTVQPHRTLFERASAGGVRCRSVGEGVLRESGLTRAALRGGDYVNAKTWGQRVAAVADIPSGSSLTYVYESDLDSTGHRSGVNSPAWRTQLALLDRYVELLLDALPAGAVMLVTADHGMVDVSPRHRVDVDADPDMTAGVELIAGEGRFRHVYTIPGAAADVAAVWRERLEAGAWVATREEAIASHVFGPVDAAVSSRLGDVVVATDTMVVEVPSRFPMESRMVGFHGSLTRAEMAVPLIVAG
jgi:hypothetical protein